MDPKKEGASTKFYMTEHIQNSHIHNKKDYKQTSNCVYKRDKNYTFI